MSFHCAAAFYFFRDALPSKEAAYSLSACRGFAELLCAPPCCHVNFTAVLFIWVWLELPQQWWPTSVKVDSLCNGKLPLQRRAASAMVDYLCRGGVP